MPLFYHGAPLGGIRKRCVEACLQPRTLAAGRAELPIVSHPLTEPPRPGCLAALVCRKSPKLPTHIRFLLGHLDRTGTRGTKRRLAQRLNTAVYVYTGPLFERMMKPLPNASPLHRVPSGYWKVIALADGRIAGFIFEQVTPRRANLCDFRTPLLEIELRARLDLFPMADDATFTDLDAELGCSTPRSARPAPSEIPKE